MTVLVRAVTAGQHLIRYILRCDLYFPGQEDIYLYTLLQLPYLPQIDSCQNLPYRDWKIYPI